MFKEFKEFVTRGNVIDLAVGVIIGGAFGKIVSSLVTDIIMPPVGMLLNGVDFAGRYLALDGKAYADLAEAQATGAPTLNYGLFINNIIDFIIVAFVIFMMIRIINKLKRQPAPVEAEPISKDCSFCFTSIPIQATRCPHCTSQLG